MQQPSKNQEMALKTNWDLYKADLQKISIEENEEVKQSGGDSQLSKLSNVIPQNVIDQIRNWEQEMNVLQMFPAFTITFTWNDLYSSFIKLLEKK